MKSDDFWYAVNNTEVVLRPSNVLETFGTTNLRYHLISELMDTVNQIRVREGTIQSGRPQVITPTYYENEILEGFGEQARQYIDWLRRNAKDLHFLQYAFRLLKPDCNEHVITGSLPEVVERVKKDVQEKKDPFTAVLVGVDTPWDVCLLKLMVDMIQISKPVNVSELNRKNLLGDSGGVPQAVREGIDQAFLQASRDPSAINGLSVMLKRYGLFEEYEDRFFALVQRSKKS